MSTSVVYIFTVFIFVHVQYTRSGSQRRLFNSFEMRNWDKPFVVYISEPQQNDYKNQFCVGAIISPNHVVTAAACLEKNVPLYVISGYRRFIQPSEWRNHKCIWRWKKRVIRICQPKEYKYESQNVKSWAKADIGIARIEGKFEFLDTSVRLDCDYNPQSINMNFQRWYVGKGGQQNSGRDFTFYTYGWGNRYGMTRPSDPSNYKEELLQWANLELAEEKKCNEWFGSEIMKVGFCVQRKRQTFDPKGNAYPTLEPTNEKCNGDMRRSNANCSSHSNEDKGFEHDDTADNESHDLKLDAIEDKGFEHDDTADDESHGLKLDAIEDKGFENDDTADDESLNLGLDDNDTRRSNTLEQGLCQNDHGAPLTTFVGSIEVLVGIGSTSLYDQKYRCREPSVFISTYDMALFIKCVLQEDPNEDNRRHNTDVNATEAQLFLRLCEKHTRQQGFVIDETILDWENVTYSDDENL